MTPADVRTRLTSALRLDLIGPDPGEPQVTEVLNVPPSRWYLTGFLVPWSAPLRQKQDEDDAQGELGFVEPATGADDDETADEPPAARRGHSHRRSASAYSYPAMRLSCASPRAGATTLRARSGRGPTWSGTAASGRKSWWYASMVRSLEQ